MIANKKKPVRGAGGGGKGGGGGAAAVEATDSLHSKQFARVVDLISEGPIVGLVDGVNSVYLNETPLATNGVFNFKDVGLNWTTGTQTQLTKSGLAAGIFGFSDVRYPNGVNVIVPSASPVVRTLSNANVNTIVVTVSTPSLLSRDASNGNTNPSVIALTIDLQSAGAGFVRKVTDTISGKTTSKYQRSYSLDVSGPGPWDIRVTKVTADSTTQMLENQLYFDDFTGVISTNLTYPNSAVIAASIDSQQFQSIPTRGYDIKGLLVKIPSNYNPVTRVYTGTWDGTFIVAWTDNPAWCYYDMLTNSRYGLGDFIDATQVDKWALYTIAQYCDVLVPSGVGTATEPRFTCNLYLQSPAEAYKVIQNMASIFRAITFWSTGSITVVQDSPQNPIALFSNANVIDGAFTYAGSSIKARHTVAQISWNDPSDFYRQKIEYVQDDDGVKTYGVVRADIVAFGCTSRGQANRLGRWLLYSEKAETETVTFRAGLDGFQLYPGAIIKTSDANRAGQRMGGRIVSATTTSATLDAPVTIAAGKTYTLSIIQPDGSIVKTAASAATGQQSVLSLAALPQVPQVNSVFVFEANDLTAETWRIIGVSQPEHHLVEVTAVKHDPTKFAQIELGQKFDAPITTSILVRPDAPINLAVRTSPYTVNGTVVGLRATFSWQSREGIFKVRWRPAGGIWQERRVTESTIDIDNVDYTAYEFQAYAINQIGRESDVATLNQSITVPAVVLPALTGLVLEGAFTSKLARIKWDACPGATSYQVVVRDTSSNTARRIVNVGNALRFDYSSSDMRADGGPWRALTFYVTPLGQFGSASAAAGSLAVTNPQVGAINGVALTGGMKTVYLSYAVPADPDYVGVQVWLSTDPTCPTVAGNLVYDGNDSLLVFRTLADKVTELVGTTNYYVRIAGYDDFGRDALTISGSLLVVPVASAPDLNTITAGMIQAGILDNTKFASNIAPIGLVASLPTVAGYTGPLVVYNTATGKLYRLTGGAWVSTVSSTDVAGVLPIGNIPSIPTSIVTGVLPLSQVPTIPTTQISGVVPLAQIPTIPTTQVSGVLPIAQIPAIPTTQLSGTISAAQITANSIGATQISTSYLYANTIQGSQIAANTITASQIASSYVYAGAIQANQIAANSVTATQISSSYVYAGSINANQITVGQITAGQIATGAITAAQIQSGAITTDKLAIGDFSNLCDNPGFEMGDIGWFKEAGWTIGNYGINAFSGSWIGRLGPSSAGCAMRNANYVDCQAGDVFYARGTLLTGVVNDRIYIRVTGITRTGAESDLGNSGSVAYVGAWAAVGFSVTIPSGIIRVRLEAFASTDASGSAFAAVDNVGLFRMSGATLIQDGAITTNKMTAASINGDRITANTLNADKIISNSITAGQIQTGTITGNLIAGNTIQADKLLIGGRNLIPNAGPAPETSAGFIAGYSTTGMTPSMGVSFGKWKPEGGGGVYITYEGIGTPANGTVSDLMANYGKQGVNGFPVTAGRTYEASAYISSHRCTGQITIAWWNASGTYIGENSGTGGVYDNSCFGPLSNWTRSTLVVAAPANAAFASVYCRSFFNGGVNPYMFCSNWYFSDAIPGQTVASPWSASASTTIDGAGIKTGSITADRINVGSLSALSANIGTVTGGDITGSVIHGGSGYPAGTGYSWPTNGGNGFMLNSQGMLLGNANLGKYLQLTDTGNIITPGFNVVDGTMTINQANVINTLNVAGNAVTAGGSNVGTSYTSVGFTPNGGRVVIFYKATWNIDLANGRDGVTLRVYRNGTQILSEAKEGGGYTGFIFDTPASGTYTTYEFTWTNFNSLGSPNIGIYVLETKK